MQAEPNVIVLVALGLVVVAAIVLFKAKQKKPPAASSASSPPPLADVLAAQKIALQHIAAQASQREAILEGEPPELVDALETAMTVSLVLLIAHGYRRNPSYFPERRAILTNLLGRPYAEREANVAEAVWDAKPDGMQVDPFVDEELIGEAASWPTAKKEQVLLGALVARNFDGRAEGDEISEARQAEIDQVISRIAEGFFGDLSGRLLESLQNEAGSRVAAVRAELAG